jgi:hypothetical protein
VSANSSPQHHEMQLVTTHPTGAEEWFCPYCGRRFLLQYPPEYKKVVLEAGDEHVTHSGGKGGLHIGVVGVQEVDTTAKDDGDEQRLAPWKDWLDNSDFESWWQR